MNESLLILCPTHFPSPSNLNQLIPTSKCSKCNHAIAHCNESRIILDLNQSAPPDHALTSPNPARPLSTSDLRPIAEPRHEGYVLVYILERSSIVADLNHTRTHTHTHTLNNTASNKHHFWTHTLNTMRASQPVCMCPGIYIVRGEPHLLFCDNRQAADQVRDILEGVQAILRWSCWLTTDSARKYLRRLRGVQSMQRQIMMYACPGVRPTFGQNCSEIVTLMRLF